MKKILLATATAAMLAASFQIGAQQSAPAPQGPAATRAQADALFTQEERNQFREKMRAAKTREERAEIRNQMRSLTEQRAKEKGITLPQRRSPGDREFGPGQRGGAPGAQLLSTEERDKFRERMRAAKTPEERATVRKEMQSTVEQRAKEKGVTLPRGPQGGPGANRDGNRPQLLTPEERQQNRDKMRAAKTPEERAALRQQMHELMEQRAKEKGITLPQGRQRGEPTQGPASTK